MDTRCYCCSISQCRTDLENLQAARAKIENACDLVLRLLSSSESYAGIFGGAASPENLGDVIDKMTTCYKDPNNTLIEAVEALDKAEIQINDCLAAMVQADAQNNPKPNLKIPPIGIQRTK